MSSDTSVYPQFKKDSMVLLKEHGLREAGPESWLHKLPEFDADKVTTLWLWNIMISFVDGVE